MPIGGPLQGRVLAGAMSLRQEYHIDSEGAKPLKKTSPFVTGIEAARVDR